MFSLFVFNENISYFFGNASDAKKVKISYFPTTSNGSSVEDSFSSSSSISGHPVTIYVTIAEEKAQTCDLMISRT